MSLLTAYLLLKYRGRRRRKYLKHQKDQNTHFSQNSEEKTNGFHRLPGPNSADSGSTNTEQTTSGSNSNASTRNTSTSSNFSIYDKSEKIIATEWLHQYQQRPVKVKFSVGTDGRIHVESRKGDRLRSININAVSAMLLEITEDPTEEPMALLRIHKEHDLVLIFDAISHRTRFVDVLKMYLFAHGKELVITPTSHQHIFATAQTKEKRQRRLERFFKIAYTRVSL